MIEFISLIRRLGRYLKYFMKDNLLVYDITSSDIDEVYLFLTKNNYNLPGNLNIDVWRSAFKIQWMPNKPNNGFMLKKDNMIVGVLCAFYSIQNISNINHAVCNLSTWFVLNEYRRHSLTLMWNILRQKGFIFTSHSMRDDLVSLHTALGFTRYNNDRLVFILNYPRLSWLFKKIKFYTDILSFKQILNNKLLRICYDHATLSRIKQVVFVDNNCSCLILYKESYSKNIRCANIIYLSNPYFYRKHKSLISKFFFIKRRLFITRIILSHLNNVHFRAIKVHNKENMMYKSKENELLSIREIYSETALT